MELTKLQNKLKTVTSNIIEKAKMLMGGKQWDRKMNPMVIEFLSHHSTPPTYVAILHVTKTLSAISFIVKELHSMSFIRNCLCTLTHTLRLDAAYVLA